MKVSSVKQDFTWQKNSSSSGNATEDTRDDISSTFSDSTGALLFSKIKALEKRKNILDRLSTGSITIPGLFEQVYHECMRSCLDVLDTLPSNLWRSRWVHMPEAPCSEDDVLAGFLSLIGEIQPLLQGSTTPQSQIFDTHKTSIPDCQGGSNLQPDIFIGGFNPLFPIINRASLSAPPWSICLTIADMKWNHGKKRMSYAQLATYAEQIFAAQDNRRFLKTFYLDHHTFIFHIFDRGGSVSGSAVNYHIDPWKFIALLQDILLTEPRRLTDLGMDRSISYTATGVTCIETLPPNDDVDTPPTVYVVTKTLFRATDLRGPGTIYWLTTAQDDASKVRLIKEAWLIGGSQHERDICASIGILPGVAALDFTYDITIDGRLDSVEMNRLRWTDCAGSLLPEDNRVHTRTAYIVRHGAKVSEKFSNEVELLETFYDAIQGHRKLYHNGFLHAHITPNRILIQPDAPEGERGILLDLSDAIKLDAVCMEMMPSLSEHLKSKVFTARNILRHDPPRVIHCIDDLESFFYVFVYLINRYDTYGTDLRSISVTNESIKNKKSRALQKSSDPGFNWPSCMDSWSNSCGGFIRKTSNFRDIQSNFVMHESFSSAIKVLLDKWWSFFMKLEREKMFHMDDTLVLDAEESYEKILKFIKEALVSLYERPSNRKRTVLRGMGDGNENVKRRKKSH